MKKCFALVFSWILLLSCALPTFAAEGNVTYHGKSAGMIFNSGSEFSPTDLFPNFKDVIPGDSITQKITIKNEASRNVKVKIYMRALGGHAESVDFLSKLRLSVEKSEDNTMAYMFEAFSHETAQLSDWICLGTLYSGGKVNLNVVLDVPVELDNNYQKQIGYLDWEFKIEEFATEPTDPQPPKTGDESRIELWFGLMAASLFALILVIFLWKRKKK